MVFTPEGGTSPRPSIEALVAFVVFQVSTTLSPAVTTVGDTEIFAVGAGAVAGGAVATGGGGSFFLQPAPATRAISKTTGTKSLLIGFNGLLLRRSRLRTLPRY